MNSIKIFIASALGVVFGIYALHMTAAGLLRFDQYLTHWPELGTSVFVIACALYSLKLFNEWVGD